MTLTDQERAACVASKVADLCCLAYEEGKALGALGFPRPPRDQFHPYTAYALRGYMDGRRKARVHATTKQQARRCA